MPQFSKFCKSLNLFFVSTGTLLLGGGTCWIAYNTSGVKDILNKIEVVDSKIDGITNSLKQYQSPLIAKINESNSTNAQKEDLIKRVVDLSNNYYARRLKSRPVNICMPLTQENKTKKSLIESLMEAGSDTDLIEKELKEYYRIN